MNNFVENIKSIIIEDKENYISNKDIENLYICELADNWIDINVKTQNEFEQKLNALGIILNHDNFQKAIEKSNLALIENDIEKRREVAELVKKIIETEEYLQNSRISGYKILGKYEDPNTYKTDSFKVHTNIMIRLYKYLNEKLIQIKGAKYGE